MNDKFAEHFTQEELDAISIEAQNNGKSPDAVLRGTLSTAKKRGKKPGEPMPESQSKAPEPPTLQTSQAAAAGDQSKQMEQTKDASVNVRKQAADRVSRSRAVSGRPSRASDLKDARPNRGKDRVPMHMRDVLTADEREGFVRRWMNDENNRLAQALDAGWDFVHKDGQERTGDSSGTQEGAGSDSRVSRPVGGGITGYLMEMPQELYDEDQRAKQRLVDASEHDMLPDDAKGDGSSSFYTNHTDGKPLQIDRS